MKRSMWGALAALALWGCGGDPIRPDENGGGGGGGGGTACTESCVAASTSLWPMTAGSTWTYRITDPTGVFQKVVRVEGERDVPDQGRKATLIISTQPHLIEHSYQLLDGDVVKRVREEDLRPDGTLARITTWTPDTIKALAEAKPVGWTSSTTIQEKIDDREKGLVDEKEKLFTWTVVAVDVPVTVMGKEYKAVQVKRVRDDKDATKDKLYWFVPGIGKVREESERTEELIDFSVK